MLKVKRTLLKPLIVTVLFCIAAQDKPKLVRTKVNESVTVFIPQGWRPMDAMDFTQRYPSVRAPLGAYTNDDRLVDFSVNVSATQWPDANIEMAKGFFKSSLLNLFDRVEMISEGIHEVHNRKYIFFEFESRVQGTRQQEGLKDPVLRYTYIQYWVEPSRTLVFSFNCPRRLKEDWQETAREMMKMVRVK